MDDARAENTRSPMRVELQLLETVADMLAQNDVPALAAHVRDPETRDSGRFLPVARASEEYVDDPSEVSLIYAAPECALRLPAGRQMQISFEGPVIDAAYLIFPMEPMDWDEMQAQVRETVALFEDAGWSVKPKPRFGPPTVIRREVTTEDLSKKTYGTKTVRLGTWTPCDAPYVEASAEVRHLNSAPSDVSIPPTRPTGGQAADAPDRFVIRVSFSIDQDAISSEIAELRQARRSVENGNSEASLPLATWVESPEWRPKGWNGTWIK